MRQQDQYLIQLTDVFDKFPVTGDDKSWMGFEFNGTASGYKLDMAGSIMSDFVESALAELRAGKRC